MTNKVYRTARGKVVDMGSLRLQNETVRAVGNMGVNARGDRIDADGNVIDPRQHQLQRQVQRQTNVSDGSVPANRSTSATVTPTPPVDPTDSFAPPEDFDTEPDVPPIDAAVSDTAPAAGAGLAGAIAKAKTVKQELEKTTRQKLQDEGVKKI